jgi:putative ABC transport system substrate-binding protein
VISRRSAVVAGSIGLLVMHRLARGQTSAQVRRVGLLFLPSEEVTTHVRAAFLQGMHDLGWIEGKNVKYQFVYADGAVDRLDTLTSELIERNVEVIVAPSPAATRAAQRATRTIPIVMASVSDPVGGGFVASLARPGGNITGIANEQEELLGKVIEILHVITLSVRRVAILLNEGAPSHASFWNAAQSACNALDLVALRIAISKPAQIEAAVGQIGSRGSQAVVVVRDGLFLNERAKLQTLMQATKLPVAYGFREHVVAGGLLSYGADLSANARYAAKYVDKILRGGKPADLPVEQPTKFELVINLRTARTLGLTVPQSLLLRADEVIQ